MSRPIRVYPASPPSGRDTADHWTMQAACGVTVSPANADLMTRAHDSDRHWAEAKAICRTCPVREQCRADSVDEPFGIWGGTDPDERKALRNTGIDPYTPRVCGRPDCETIFTPRWRGPRLYCGDVCRLFMRDQQIQLHKRRGAA